MKRRVTTVIVAVLVFMAACQAWGGQWTGNGFIYKPAVGARGASEKGVYDSGLDRVDARLGKEIWVGDPNYGPSLQAAVTAIGGANAILRIPPGTLNISENLSIPSNITLNPERGAILAIATGATLTINRLEAGDYQVFSGTGKVVWKGPGPVKAAWWGLGAGVDDSAALQAAIVACKDGGLNAPVLVGVGTFDLSSARVNFYKGVPVIGISPQATRFTSTANSPVFGTAEDLWNTGADGWTPVLSNCTIDLTANPHNIYAIYFDYSFNRCSLSDINILGNSAAAQGGIWCYHTSPIAGNNLFDNNLFNNINFRNLKATTGCMRLEGNSTPPGQQCNNNLIWHCAFGQYKQGIFINGSNNVIGGGNIINHPDNPVLETGGGTDFRVIIDGSGSVNNYILEAYFDQSGGTVCVKAHGAVMGGLAPVVTVGDAANGINERGQIADLGTNTGRAAAFVSAQTVTVPEDITGIYKAGYKIWWVNNSDGQWYSNTPAIDSTYGGGVTTITIPASGSQFSQNCTIYREPNYWRAKLPAGTLNPAEQGPTKFSQAFADQLFIGPGSTTALTKIIRGAESINLGSIDAGGSRTLVIPAVGAVAGQTVFITPPIGLEAGLLIEKWWTAADEVRVSLYNRTAASIDPAAGTWRFMIVNFN